MLVDNSLNVAFAIKYFIYAAFGASGVFSVIPSVALVGGVTAARALGLVVFVLGVAVGTSALKSLSSVKWERREFYGTIALIAFIGMYNASLIYLALHGIGDRVGLAIIATALLVFPIWKLRYILRKNRQR